MRGPRLLLAGLGLAGLLSLPLAALAGQGPRLHLEQKELDFGELIQGRTLELSIPIENRGDQPLLLTKAEPSCGCTLTALPKEPIPPGGKAALGVRFESKGRLGLQSVTVAIWSNDPSQDDQGRGCTVVTLRGEVRSLFRATPAGAFFGELVRGQDPGPRQVQLQGLGPARGGFQAHLEGELPDWLSAKLTPGPSPERWVLEVHLLPGAPIGEVSATLDVVTDVKDQPRISLPVVAIVTAGIVAPEYVHLLRNPRGERVERRVPLERRDGKKGIAVRGVEVDPRWLEADLEPISDERLDLLLTLKAGAPSGPFATEVIVRLADPELPRLTIPVFGVVAPTAVADPPELLFPPTSDADVVRVISFRGGRIEEALPPEGTPLLVEVLPAERGLQRIKVTLPAGAKLAQGGRLVLRTTVEGEERVGVPVVVFDPTAPAEPGGD